MNVWYDFGHREIIDLAPEEVIDLSNEPNIVEL